jgi:hypothetical protein
MDGWPADLRTEQAALIAEHNDLMVIHEAMVDGRMTMAELRAHAERLVRHRLRVGRLIQALEAWRRPRR